MEYKINGTSKSKILFCDIKIGEIFRWDSCLYVKSSTATSAANTENLIINAVDLQTGALVRVPPDMDVERYVKTVEFEEDGFVKDMNME